jgi:hypothetical protein
LEYKLAELVFRETIADSIPHIISGWLQHPQLMIKEVVSAFPTVSELKWNPAHALRPHDAQGIALWLRVNVPHLLLSTWFGPSTETFQKERPARDMTYLEHKIDTFVNQHVPCVMAYDSSANGTYSPLDTYVPLPPTRYPDDDRFIHKTVTSHKLKDSAFVIVCRAFPDKTWEPVEYVNRYLCRMSAAKLHELWHVTLPAYYHPLGGANVGRIEDYSIYIACLLIMRDLQELEGRKDVSDALYQFRASFVDLFYYALTSPDYVRLFSDTHLLTPSEKGADYGRTPWEIYYPCHTERVFTGDDLPNMWHLFSYISLWGENNAPDFPMARIFSKILPYCCGRRQLIPYIAAQCAHLAFFRVFSKVMWCALTGLYPHTVLAVDGEVKRCDIRHMMRVKELCSNRALLVNALTMQLQYDALKARDDISTAERKSALKALNLERDANCLVVFVAFRLYYLHMAYGQTAYIDCANMVIDWGAFCADTAVLATHLRTSNMFMADAFACARAALEQALNATSGVSGNIYRLRKFSLAATLAHHCNEELRDNIYSAAVDWERDVQLLEKMKAASKTGQGMSQCIEIVKQTLVEPEFDQWRFGDTNVESFHAEIETQLQRAVRTRDELLTELSSTVKDNIFNLLVRLHPEERFSPVAVGALRLLDYGGITDQAACVVLRLVEIYRESALKQAIRQQLDTLQVAEFRVIAWYVHVVAMLDAITFAPIDYDTTLNIAQAMRFKRYCLHPDQKLSPNCWDTVISLCCGKVSRRLLFCALTRTRWRPSPSKETTGTSSLHTMPFPAPLHVPTRSRSLQPKNSNRTTQMPREAC